MLSDKRRRMRFRAEFSYTYSSLLECLKGLYRCGIVDAGRTGVLWFWCAFGHSVLPLADELYFACCSHYFQDAASGHYYRVIPSHSVQTAVPVRFWLLRPEKELWKCSKHYKVVLQPFLSARNFPVSFWKNTAFVQFSFGKVDSRMIPILLGLNQRSLPFCSVTISLVFVGDDGSAPI